MLSGSPCTRPRCPRTETLLQRRLVTSRTPRYRHTARPRLERQGLWSSLSLSLALGCATDDQYVADRDSCLTFFPINYLPLVISFVSDLSEQAPMPRTRRHRGAGALMHRMPTMCVAHRSSLLAAVAIARVRLAGLGPGQRWLATNEGRLALLVISRAPHRTVNYDVKTD